MSAITKTIFASTPMDIMSLEVKGSKGSKGSRESGGGKGSRPETKRN